MSGRSIGLMHRFPLRFDIDRNSFVVGAVVLADHRSYFDHLGLDCATMDDRTLPHRNYFLDFHHHDHHVDVVHNFLHETAAAVEIHLDYFARRVYNRSDAIDHHHLRRHVGLVHGRGQLHLHLVI